MPVVKIEVTAEHLAAGERFQPARNPVAKALGDVFGFPVLVDRRTFLAIDPGDRERRHTGYLPPSTARWLTLFEHGAKALNEFAFFVDVPEWLSCLATPAATHSNPSGT